MKFTKKSTCTLLPLQIFLVQVISSFSFFLYPGDEVWSTGFGTADFSSGQPVDADTLFGIGSVTKSFTTALLGILLPENGYVANNRAGFSLRTL